MERVKLQRLNNTFMEELNLIFGKDIKNPILKKVVVNAVKITNDLSFAKVYFTCFDEDIKEVLKLLEESSGFLRKELAMKINLRHTPDLTFVYDESLEYAKRIEKKLKEIKENE